MMLASNEVYGLWPVLVGALVALFALAAISCIPSARGHWSGPVLAIIPWVTCTLALVPLLLGAVSSPFSWNGFLIFPALVSGVSFLLFIRARMRRDRT